MNRQLTLRPFADEDISLMAGWLKKEHVRKWYHDPEDWLDEIAQRHGEYRWIHHFIVMAGDSPIGFCQYYDCYDARELELWYTVDTPKDTFSIDYMIGEEASLGKGYGKEIVRQLTEMIRTGEKGKRIVVQPERENEASNHVLMANGYVFNDQMDYYEKTLA